MEIFFNIKFLKSEYAITNGRMDSIGIDENYSPVIFEYKRSSNENVINQGLFYLDWLLDHKADFTLLVLNTFGKDMADKIDWSVPCVICIANDFTKYDIHAVNQMQRNIKLVKYRKLDNGLIMFEHLNNPVINQLETGDITSTNEKKTPKNHIEKIKDSPNNIKTLYYEICNYIESLGDDISSNQLKYYIAYRTTQNIACIEVLKKQISIYLKLNPENIDLEEGFTKNMSGIGHFGTGDLQVSIKNIDDFMKAKPLIEKAYNES
jgi:predicted transport protein